MLIRAGSMPARSVLAVAPNLPPRVAEVIDKALAFLPADRWPDARAMQAVLEDAYLFSYGAPLPRGLESSRPPSSSAAAPAPAVNPRALTEHLAFPLVPSSQKATTTNGLAQQDEIRIPLRIPWGTLVLGACALAGVVVGTLAFEGKGPFGGHPPPAPLSAERPSALPEARPVAPAVSIAPPLSAVPKPPGASAAPAVDAGASIEAHPFVDGGAPSAGPSASAVNAARPTVVPTPTADVRPSSTPPSPAMPPETNPTIPGCNPTFVIDTEGHKIFKPECFPGKAPPL
jgi:serine/threonine-protein kinase